MIQVILLLAMLTATYALTVTSFAWEDLAMGFGLSVVLLAVFRKAMLPETLQSPGRTLEAVVWLPIYILQVIWSIVIGTLTVAAVVVGVRKLEHPGIVKVPMGDRTEGGVAVTELALTLSPGSFIVENNWEERVMYIHVLDASDPDAVREEFQTMYERYQRHVVP